MEGFIANTPLHVGDYVVLRLSKPDEGWLSSEGLLDDECFTTTNTDDFSNCVWQIHVQNQYSAAREYKEALSQSLSTTDIAKDSGKLIKVAKKSASSEHLSQLHRAALNEQRLNDKLMSLKMGKSINFGDPIQLLHVKSRKFLTISSNVLAREERENMRVNVDEDGDSLSCIGFIPRFRYEREGQVLTNNSDVLVRVHERPGEYLHTSKSSTSTNGVCEVNCSLESSYWTILLYQQIADVHSNTIMAGQLVMLQDPDSLSCLSVDSQIPGVTEHGSVVMSSQLQTRDVNAESVVGTHLLWMVEKASVVAGGPIMIDDEGVTLRDLNSGLFMRLEANGLVAVKERSLASTFEFHSSSNSNQYESRAMESDAAVHMMSENMWIGYAARSETDVNTGNIKCAGHFEKGSALSICLTASLFHKIGAQLHVGVQATMKLRRMLQVTSDYEQGNLPLRDLAQEVKTSTAVLESLCAFLTVVHSVSKDELVNEKNLELITVRQHMMREQGLIDALLDLLAVTESNIFDKVREPIAKRNSQTRVSARRVIRNAATSNIAAKVDSDELDDPLPSTDQPKQQRRSSFSLLLGGVGLDKNKIPTKSTELAPMKGQDRSKNLQELMALKHKPHDINDPGDSGDDDDDDDQDEDDDNPDDMKDGHPLTVSQLLAQKCLKVLLCVMVNNFPNQLRVADRFPILLAEVRDHRLAVLCVEEMLRENLTILQTKVRQREIDIFVNLLAKSEMSVTFLRLLQSTCSCPMGVDATQRMVANALFQSPNTPLRSRAPSAAVDNCESPSLVMSVGPPRASPKLGGIENRKRLMSADGELCYQRLTIQISTDHSKRFQVEWGDLSLFLPPQVEKSVLGHELLVEGLPEIWLQWKMTGKNGDFGMQTLFGYRDKVPLSIICAAARKSLVGKGKALSAMDAITARAMRRKASVHKKRALSVRPHAPNQTIVTISNYKAQVAEYFRTQLYLVADLCLDRNYVAIGMLEPLYPYESMVAILKNPNIPAGFKAPVCRILRCLYVDRDPQIESKFPHYIRTSVSLATDSAKNEDEIKDDDAKLFRFALIQKLVSEYVHNDLDLSTSNEMSAEIIELLESLVKFGFYERVPQILDILKPLLKVLHAHQTTAGKSSLDIDSSSINSTDDNATKFRKSIIQLSAQFLPASNSGSKYQNLSLSDDHEGEFIGDESTEAINKKPWHKIWLERSESLMWMIVVFLVVIVSVVLMVVELLSSNNFTGFYIATTIFFGLEYFSRLTLFYLGNQSIYKFVVDPFNILDILLVLCDVIMLALGSDASQASATRATRSLRIIRIIRVGRLVRAGRLLRNMAAASTSRKGWEVPSRFKLIKQHEAKTMVNILTVLTMFYDRIQDHTLDLGIRAFSQWCRAVKNQEACDPIETYQKALASEERLSSELSHKFDSVLLDAMMYADKDITHAALNLLMVHKSQKDMFFNVFEKIQIVYSPRIEKICQQLTSMLRELQGLAEMFEIWSELETENDLKSAARALQILKDIMSYLTKFNEDRTLGIRSVVLVDEEVQNLLRNSDAMTTFMALQESLYDGGREELKPEVRTILCTCNDLICLFVKTSEANQAVAFKSLQWFVDRVDDNINSSKVVRAILEGNKMLIKQCSRRYLAEFARKIVAKGRNPDYLDLFVGMTELSEVMDSHVLVVESEISSFLTGREWKKHLLLWCAAPGTIEYEQRRLAMQFVARQCLPNEVVVEEDLNADLKYHVRLLTLLASCNLGPKLHAVYPVQDILDAILDVDTIYPVRKALGLLLIEVLKSSSDRVEKLNTFWQFLEHLSTSIDTLPTEMLALSREHGKRIQRGEWLEIGAGVITTFFIDFDLNHYLDSIADKTGKDQSQDAKVIVERLYHSVRQLLDYHSVKLGGVVTEELQFAASVLRSFLDPESQDDNDAADDTKLKVMRMQHKRTSVVYADVQQVYFRKQFKVFLRHVRSSIRTSRDEIIEVFKSLPRITDAVEADVRFEPLLKKISSHFRASIKRSPLSRSMAEGSVETCVWFLKVMRYLLEDAMEIQLESFNEIDTSLIKNSEKVEKLRTAFNDNGITYLCLDLIAVGMDHSLYIEAIKLLIVMLLKSGGCRHIQKCIHSFLQETDSILFYELLKDMTESLKSWCQKENENMLLLNSGPTRGQINPPKKAVSTSLPLNKIDNIPEDIIVLNLLQGICEGSFMGNRDQIREQTGNSKMVNILETLASFVGVLSRADNFSGQTKMMCMLLKTILRLIQGPCKGNQEQFVLHSELLISLNRMIRSIRPNATAASVADEVESDGQFEALKEAMIDVLRGVIEGQHKKSLVFDRVSSTIDFGVLQMLVIPPDQELLERIMGPIALSKAQAKFLVLSESMKKSEMPSWVAAANSKIMQVSTTEKHDIASVEVQWNSDIQVVFFPVPQFVKDLSAESKEKLLDSDQDFASRELKLIDFASRVKTVHRESKHQQFLKTYGLGDLWSFKFYMTRFMFLNALVMNVIILAFYGSEVEHHDYYASHRMLASTGGTTTKTEKGILFVPEHIHLIIWYLNIVQLVFAVGTVAIFLIVKVPIIFKTEYEKRQAVWPSLFFAVLDPLTIWYMAYLVFTFLGLEVHQFFLSALLLDWVILDPTTQDLLLAVFYPARQLVATLVIILIMQNIFAGVMFLFYREDVVTVPVRDMWDALKLCISYGFRGEYGIDHEMEPTLGIRMVMDVAFYFIMLSILRHIFFAIIVDTFGKLRELKFERESEAKNTCFVCGIERHDFDRMVPAGTSLSFAHHRNVVHNPLNYMAFIMNIWKQNESEDSSLEIYVRECLRKGNVGWFPSSALHELESLVEAHVIDEAAIKSITLSAPSHDHGKGKHGGGHGGGGSGGSGGSGGNGHKKDEHRDSLVSASGVSSAVAVHHSRQRGDSGTNDDSHNGHASPVIPRRPRTAGAGIADRENLELIDKMQMMHQQLLHISSSINNTSQANVAVATQLDTSLSNTSLVDGSIVKPSMPSMRESDPAMLTAVTQMNDAMINMMNRIDQMEKNLTKSHRYLRHRLRMSNPSAKHLPHPLAGSPGRGPMHMPRPKDKVRQQPPVCSDTDEDIVNAVSNPNADLTNQSSSHQSHVVEQPALPSQSSLEQLRPGADKLENSSVSSDASDEESSLHTAVPSDDDDPGDDDDGNEETKMQSPAFSKPISANHARPSSAVAKSSEVISPSHQRPQSAHAFSGPPRSLLDNLNK